MKVLIEHTLRDYLSFADETQRSILERSSIVTSSLDAFSAFFERELWADEVAQMSPNQAFLSMHAFMIWIAAVRVSLSGHAAATFPLFRSALEAACYAFLIKDDPDLEKVWVERHRSPEALKKSRQAFNSAVKVAGQRIDDSGSPGVADWLMQGYDGAIDHGAHPNPRSIYRHVVPPKEAGDHMLVSLTGLHGPDDTETLRSLVACLDYGQLVATVLVHGLPQPTEEHVAKLVRLNDLKERLVDELQKNE